MKAVTWGDGEPEKIIDLCWSVLSKLQLEYKKLFFKKSARNYSFFKKGNVSFSLILYYYYYVWSLLNDPLFNSHLKLWWHWLSGPQSSSYRSIPVITWSWSGHLAIDSQLENCSILEPHDCNFRPSLLTSAKQSSWGNQQEIKNSNHMILCLTTPMCQVWRIRTMC